MDPDGGSVYNRTLGGAGYFAKDGTWYDENWIMSYWDAANKLGNLSPSLTYQSSINNVLLKSPTGSCFNGTHFLFVDPIVDNMTIMDLNFQYVANSTPGFDGTVRDCIWNPRNLTWQIIGDDNNKIFEVYPNLTQTTFTVDISGNSTDPSGIALINYTYVIYDRLSQNLYFYEYAPPPPTLTISFMNYSKEIKTYPDTFVLNSSGLNDVLDGGCSCSGCSLSGSDCMIPTTFNFLDDMVLQVNVSNSSYLYGVAGCNDPYNKTIMNISYFNENGGSPISASNEYMLDVTSPFTQSIASTFSSSKSSAFCTNVNTTLRGITYSIDGSMVVSATGYETNIIENDASSLYVVETNPHYYLPIYLIDTGNSSQVAFTVKSSVTKSTLEGVLVKMFQYINGTPVQVNSKSTDITGQAVFDYIIDKPYLINFSLSNYRTLSTQFSPITSSSYDIYMVPINTISRTDPLTRVSITYSPNDIYQDGDNNFSITFYSPYSELLSYGYSLEYPSGTITGSGTSGSGQLFQNNITITSPSIYDQVKLTINFNSSVTDYQEYIYYFGIDVAPGNYTMMDNKNNTYGLGLFERLLLSTFVVLLFVGIAAMVGQLMAGMFLGFMIWGYFIFIGFIPIWAVLISLTAAIIIMGGRSQ